MPNIYFKGQAYDQYTLSNLWKTEQPYRPLRLLWLFCCFTFQHYFSHTEHMLTSLCYIFTWRKKKDLISLAQDRNLLHEPELFPALNFKTHGVYFCCVHTSAKTHYFDHIRQIVSQNIFPHITFSCGRKEA